MQEFPQRLTFDGHADLRPLSGLDGALADRLFDLLSRLGRLPPVVDADVDGTIALSAQAGYETCAQNRGLAQTGLAEQHGEQLALHSAPELGDFAVAAVKECAGFFGEGGKAEPRVAGIDGGRGFRRRSRCEVRQFCVHSERALVKSASRCANSGETSPACSWVKCNALNLSGTSASFAFVASIVTGRMNSAPSAIFRTRSSA